MNDDVGPKKKKRKSRRLSAVFCCAGFNDGYPPIYNSSLRRVFIVM